MIQAPLIDLKSLNEPSARAAGTSDRRCLRWPAQV